MNGCIYRTKDGECDLYAEGGKFTAFCEMENCEGRKLSNADRIRDMDDYELALWIKSASCDAVLSGAKTADYWLDWLRTEVEE